MSCRIPLLGLGCFAAAGLLHCGLLVDTDNLAGGSGDGGAGDGDASGPPSVDASADSGPPTAFGTPSVLVGNLRRPSLLAADDTSVYWIDGDVTDTDAVLYRRRETGEDVPTVLVDGLRAPRAMGLDPSRVYFTSGSGMGWTHIRSVLKAGGSPSEPLASNGSGTAQFPALSIEGTGLAYVVREDANKGAIQRRNTDGGGKLAVAASQSGASAVILRAPYVYWNTTRGIMRSNGEAPQAPEPFSDQATGTAELAADGDALYWATVDGALRSLRFDRPGSAATILASDLRAPRGLVVDDAHLYWADTVSGDVFAMPKSGGARVSLATGRQEPFALAVNRKAVFFVDRASGELLRVSKE